MATTTVATTALTDGVTDVQMAAYTTTVSTMVATTGYVSALASPPFRGTTQEDGEVWLSRSEKYVAYRRN